MVLMFSESTTFKVSKDRLNVETLNIEKHDCILLPGGYFFNLGATNSLRISTVTFTTRQDHKGGYKNFFPQVNLKLN